MQRDCIGSEIRFITILPAQIKSYIISLFMATDLIFLNFWLCTLLFFICCCNYANFPTVG